MIPQLKWVEGPRSVLPDDTFAHQLFHAAGALAATTVLRQLAAKEICDMVPIRDVEDRGMEPPQPARLYPVPKTGQVGAFPVGLQRE